MLTMAERLARSHPSKQQRFIVPVNQQQALDYLRIVAGTIEQMEDFERFPEGAMGVVIHAVLQTAVAACPDVGDFGYVTQGASHILRASFGELSKDLRR